MEDIQPDKLNPTSSLHNVHMPDLSSHQSSKVVLKVQQEHSQLCRIVGLISKYPTRNRVGNCNQFQQVLAREGSFKISGCCPSSRCYVVRVGTFGRIKGGRVLMINVVTTMHAVLSAPLRNRTA